MSDDKVVHFKPREKPKPAASRRLFLICRCDNDTFEICADGEVFCSKCGISSTVARSYDPRVGFGLAGQIPQDREAQVWTCQTMIGTRECGNQARWELHDGGVIICRDCRTPKWIRWFDPNEPPPKAG